MHHFTPESSLLGGTLIGIATVLLYCLNGKLAGISSIVLHLSFPQKANDNLWRVVFLSGLVAGVAIFYALHGKPEVRENFPVLWLLASGILTGFGTAYSNGCTSGHGVCGLARLSARSLAATLTFLVSGIITASIVHHLSGVN